MVRNPINFPKAYARPFHVQEGIIESWWMSYDIWLNLKFHKENELVEIRKDMFPPIAQFVPVHLDSYQEKWKTEECVLDNHTEDGKEIWNKWQDYNHQKWVEKNEKDPLTFHKNRKKEINKLRNENE